MTRLYDKLDRTTKSVGTYNLEAFYRITPRALKAEVRLHQQVETGKR